jgi:glycine reductase complex component B subunit alpha and beta
MLVVSDHPVSSVDVGGWGYEDGRLSVDLSALAGLIEQDPRVARAHLGVVRPGDRTRVANILDIFDARKKVEGPSFPGHDGPVETAGQGTLHRFSDLQIIGCARLPTGGGGVRVARRAFIDFWGEGVKWTPFGSTFSLVVDVEFARGVEDQLSADDAVRRALITASTTVGALGIASSDPDTSVETHHSFWGRQAGTDGPRIAYVYQVQSHGPLLDTFLYGSPVAGLHPTLLDATEILDGALVSGTRGRITTPTILHCNNPIVRRLADERQTEVNLLPVILMEGHHKTTEAKRRSAQHAVQLLRLVRADGAIFTQEGGGMSIVDQMLTIEGARKVGIECVAITYEMAGAEGQDRPLIYYKRAAKNLVSTGNRDEKIQLDAPEQVLGAHDQRASPMSGRVTPAPAGATASTASATLLADRAAASSEESESVDLSGEVEVPVWCLYGSVSQVGAGRVRGHAASVGAAGTPAGAVR